MFRFSNRSIEKLSRVHPLLVGVVVRALSISKVDFGVSEGIRFIERQRALVRQGRSKTMNSQHLPRPLDLSLGDVVEGGDGRAVDLYPSGYAKVEDIPMDAYRAVHEAMKQASEELGVLITWGNDWDGDGVEVALDPDESFVDAPHFQLRRWS